MEFDRVAAIVDGVPHMTLRQGRAVYDFVVRERPAQVLELGFASGVSTCYLAAALEEVGDTGRVVTVDIPDALTRSPDIHQLLEQTGLAHLVDIRIDPTSYTWELKRMLEQPVRPSFDFVFLDGAHTWDVDALAFLLVDGLVAPGGWVLFDDLDWTLAGSPSMAAVDWVQALPVERQKAQQVRAVVELLVRSGDYDEVIERDGWAWARKSPPGAGVRTYREASTRLTAAEAAIADRVARLAAAEAARAATTVQLVEVTRQRDAARAGQAESAQAARLWQRRYEKLRGRLPIRAAARVAGPIRAAVRHAR